MSSSDRYSYDRTAAAFPRTQEMIKALRQCHSDYLLVASELVKAAEVEKDPAKKQTIEKAIEALKNSGFGMRAGPELLSALMEVAGLKYLTVFKMSYDRRVADTVGDAKKGLADLRNHLDAAYTLHWDVRTDLQDAIHAGLVDGATKKAYEEALKHIEKAMGMSSEFYKLLEAVGKASMK